MRDIFSVLLWESNNSTLSDLAAKPETFLASSKGMARGFHDRELGLCLDEPWEFMIILPLYDRKLFRSDSL